MLIYNLGIRLFGLSIRFWSLFSEKAALWIQGRKELFQQLSQLKSESRPIWIHVASLGEFEQARPLIEKLRLKYPQTKQVLTFFSPSGYEIRKKFDLVDDVYYLPLDTPQNAHRFVDSTNPRLAIFVKYDLWFNHILVCQKREIPIILISALFRKDQYFFKPWGQKFLEILKGFDHIFLQNIHSYGLLLKCGFRNISVHGDTRIDRAMDLMNRARPHALLKSFVGKSPCLIIGSNWPEDDKIIIPFIHKHLPDNWKVILAPHEINEKRISDLITYFPKEKVTLFTTDQAIQSKQVLILNTIGHLSAAYKVGTVAYIGGGFKTGLHNTLEPASAGIPIIFGPNFDKFIEAVDFIQLGLAFSVKDEKDLVHVFKSISSQLDTNKFVDLAQLYLKKNIGASDKVMTFIEERNYLV